jgi:hypothetical protein
MSWHSLSGSGEHLRHTSTSREAPEFPGQERFRHQTEELRGIETPTFP